MKYVILFLSITWGLCSCTSGLDIKQDYPFGIKTYPLPRKLRQGETVALEFTLVRKERYKYAEYSFRYFQPEGKGFLTDDKGRELVMNRLYRINVERFTLLYRSSCLENQQLDFVFVDNFGQEVEYSVSFQSDRNEEEE